MVVADVLLEGPDQPAVPHLLQDMGRPAGDPGHGEGRRKQLAGQADAVEQLRNLHRKLERLRSLSPLGNTSTLEDVIKRVNLLTKLLQDVTTAGR